MVTLFLQAMLMVTLGKQDFQKTGLLSVMEQYIFCKTLMAVGVFGQYQTILMFKWMNVLSERKTLFLKGLQVCDTTHFSQVNLHQCCHFMSGTLITGKMLVGTGVIDTSFFLCQYAVF